MQDYVMHDTLKYEIQYSDLTLGIVYKNEFNLQQIQTHLHGDLPNNIPSLQIVYDCSPFLITTPITK
jgi:hypothetical protein